jgi:hypothetical protein
MREPGRRTGQKCDSEIMSDELHRMRERDHFPQNGFGPRTFDVLKSLIV